MHMPNGLSKYLKKELFDSKKQALKWFIFYVITILVKKGDIFQSEIFIEKKWIAKFKKGEINELIYSIYNFDKDFKRFKVCTHFCLRII